MFVFPLPFLPVKIHLLGWDIQVLEILPFLGLGVADQWHCCCLLCTHLLGNYGAAFIDNVGKITMSSLLLWFEKPVSIKEHTLSSFTPTYIKYVELICTTVNLWMLFPTRNGICSLLIFGNCHRPGRCLQFSKATTGFYWLIYMFLFQVFLHLLFMLCSFV